MSNRVQWKKLRKKIPAKVRVNKKDYEILWAEAFSHPDVVGEKRVDPNQIVLKTEETDEETVKTLIHEFFHALADEHGAKLTEAQVQKLEKGSADLIRFFEELLK